jgi:hypothetical protein
MEHPSEQAKVPEQQSTEHNASAEKESTTVATPDQQSAQPAISDQQPKKPAVSETKQPSDIDWPAQPERPKPHHGFFWHLLHR